MPTRYPLLYDFNWLKNAYEIKQLSMSEMAAIAGCSKDAVRLALIRNKIPIRSSKDSNKIRLSRSERKSKYEKLNDKKWLKQKYEVEGLSTAKISELAGAKTCNSARQALIKYNIKIRSIKEGITFNRQEDFFVFNQSVIIGCLLGDGGLGCYNRQGNSNAFFFKKNKNYDHITYVANLLFEKNKEKRIKEGGNECNGKYCKYFSLRTLTHEALTKIDKEWYPKEHNYNKIIPKNLKIDATVLLHWFLDDGSTSFCKNSVRAVFCSESFHKNDQKMLVDKIHNMFPDLKLTLNKCNSGFGWRVGIKPNSLNIFYDIIGPCPVPSLAYKWKHPKFTRL
ncbi:MAG: hypothetical protein DWQ19_09590 [Crenarchaeota archaeon]|nr:MAG: hypothetical protein DWQ19_09590 [Thermoproteota archaeon]